tara:strand:- start:44 stop:310 length:267 start_codon:yes stop_codon:yes gene_type:complete
MKYSKLNKWNFSIPDTHEKNINDACRRVIFYIIEYDWGVRASCKRAATCYGIKPYSLYKIIKSIFPKDYFINAQKRRNGIFLKELSGI